MLKLGYKASAEQFGPRELLDYAVAAEGAGFDSVVVSDHFQPWRHHGGHAPNALVWLGAATQATRRVVLGTSVLTPTLRYNPAVVAQAFGTLGCLAPGRVILGVGTGESLNETPVGVAWPEQSERFARLRESVGLIQQLSRGERLTIHGEHYSVANATIYDRPDEPVPIYIAASGPLAAAMAGRITVAEVEEIVEVGSIDPDAVHLPGIYVHRIVLNAHPEKRIEKRTLSATVTTEAVKQAAAMETEKIIAKAADKADA